MLTVASLHAVRRNWVLESHFSSCSQEKWRANAELQSGRKIIKSTWQQPDCWCLVTSCYPVVSLPGHRRNCLAICTEIRPYSYRCEITAIVLSHTSSEYLLSACDSSSCCEPAKKNRTFFSLVVAIFFTAGSVTKVKHKLFKPKPLWKKLDISTTSGSTNCATDEWAWLQRFNAWCTCFTIIMWVHSEIWLAPSIFWLWN